MTNRPGDMWQRQRRRSRQALAVIPDMTSLSMSVMRSPRLASPNTIINTNNNNNNNEMRGAMSSPWYATAATSSPDELVIQKRGRRSKPIIWSPEADSKRSCLLNYSSLERTPTKADIELTSPFMLRPEHMAIRKRLDLSSDDYNESSMLTTPEKKRRTLTSTSFSEFNGSNLTDGLKTLSNVQLINIIMDLVKMQEQGNLSSDRVALRDVVMKLIPPADINPLVEKLKSFQQNICSDIRIRDTQNSSYLCAYIDAFINTLKEQGNILIRSQHWISLMEYVFTAWAIIKDLLMWDNGSTSQKCFYHLVNFCKQALMHGNFAHSVLAVYAEKMEAMIQDCDNMTICLEMAREILR